MMNSTVQCQTTKYKADVDFTPNVCDDTYLNKEIAKARGAGDDKDVQYGRVTKRLRDADGRPIGTAHDNPLHAA